MSCGDDEYNCRLCFENVFYYFAHSVIFTVSMMLNMADFLCQNSKEYNIQNCLTLQPQPELLHFRVEWYSTFCHFRKWALCCRLGILYFLESKNSANLASQARGKEFNFQTITGTFAINIFFRKFASTFLLLQEQSPKINLEKNVTCF